jgi:hypothetical protein
MNVQRHLMIACVVLLMLPTAACASGADLRAVTTTAVTSTLDAESWRVQGAASYSADGEALETTWEGEFAAPDRSRMRITTGTGTWCEATRIGEQSYVSTSEMPESGGAASGAACVMLSMAGLLEPLEVLIDVERLADEEIDGVQCLHYRGRLDMDALVQREEARAGPEASRESLELMRRGSIEVELWVGKDDYLIRRMRRLDRLPVLEAESQEEKWTKQSMVLRLYDFNEPIAIELPPLGSSGG